MLQYLCLYEGGITMGRLFKVETHLHTAEGSACAKSSGAEMARAYKAHGYDTIIITDHFFGGNTAVPKNLPWEERIDRYFKGYENAKAEGDKIGLTVLPGMEWAYHGIEFLTYGLPKSWLCAHPEMEEWEPETFMEKAHMMDAFIVHAHPFRWSDTPMLYPLYVDGVEVYNAGNPDKANELAKDYAARFRLPTTAGSDEHNHAAFRGSGMAFQTPIATISDFIRAVRTNQPYEALLSDGKWSK